MSGSTDQNALLAAALDYASRGWQVFPVQGKIPLTRHGFKDATTDAATICDWWKRWPDAGIGIRTSSERAVLDVDCHGETNGVTVLLHRHGLDVDEWPGPVARTGGGGWHLYGTAPAGTRCRPVTDVGDLKAEGGYVVAPPSPHPSGGSYAWRDDMDPDTPLTPLPVWVVDGQPATAARRQRADYERLLAEGVEEGKRHNSAASLAGHLLARGLPRAEVQAVLTSWNARNRPPLPEGELIRIVDDLARKDAAKAALESGDPEAVADNRQAALALLSERLGLTISDVREIQGDDPLLELITPQGSARMRKRISVSNAQFRKEVGCALDVLPCRLKSDAWDSTWTLLARVARKVSAGPEAYATSLIKNLVLGHIQSHTSHAPCAYGELLEKVGEEPVAALAAVVHEGAIWISLEELREYIEASTGEKQTLGRLAQLMSAAGSRSRPIRFRLDRSEDGEVTQRRKWRIPREWVEDENVEAIGSKGMTL